MPLKKQQQPPRRLEIVLRKKSNSVVSCETRHAVKCAAEVYNEQ